MVHCVFESVLNISFSNFSVALQDVPRHDKSIRHSAVEEEKVKKIKSPFKSQISKMKFVLIPLGLLCKILLNFVIFVRLNPH